MKEVRTEIGINASAQRVWEILVDFGKYELWNPFLRRIDGQAKEGSQLKIRIETPSGRKRKYEPIVTKVEEGRELRWLGKSSLPGFLNGEHIFTIEQAGSAQVRFVHRELFGGVLVPFFARSLDGDVKQGFEEMNKALKERAERTG